MDDKQLDVLQTAVEQLLGASILEALQHKRYVLVELDSDRIPVVTPVPDSMYAVVNLLKYGST